MLSLANPANVRTVQNYACPQVMIPLQLGDISVLPSLLLILFVLPVSAQTANSEWRYYGGDEGGSRFSPLAQVNTSNVQSLKRAWTYHTGELDLGLRTASFQASFSCTPLVVDGVMYLSTPSSRVIALDAETGRELWKFDPQANKSQREFNSHRGVAYWEDK